jgi:hypothetical protein
MGCMCVSLGHSACLCACVLVQLGWAYRVSCASVDASHLAVTRTCTREMLGMCTSSSSGAWTLRSGRAVTNKLELKRSGCGVT